MNYLHKIPNDFSFFPIVLSYFDFGEYDASSDEESFIYFYYIPLGILSSDTTLLVIFDACLSMSFKGFDSCFLTFIF